MPIVPDFPARKVGTSLRGGELIPDISSTKSQSGARGKYPLDAGGPPQPEVGSKGPSGDPKEITAVTTTYERPMPKPSPRADTSNPIK